MKENLEIMESWQELVKITQRFIKMEPWKQFEDMELFGLKIKGQKEIVYPSIMGFHNLCYGISFYLGKNGFDDLASVAFDAGSERFSHYLIMESQFMSVYFDDQDNVSYEQDKIYKKLGLSKEQYMHFTIKEKGYFPRHPALKEVKKYIAYINALIEAIDYFFKKEIRIDFKKQLFYYDVQNKTHQIRKINLKPKEYPLILLENLEYVDSLKELKRVNEEWEIEMNYTDQGMMCDGDKLANVRLCMIANATTGVVLNCVALSPEEDEVEVTLFTFLKMLEDNGVPNMLMFGNDRIHAILATTCKVLGIEFIQADELNVLDDFMEAYYEFNKNEQVS